METDPRPTPPMSASALAPSPPHARVRFEFVGALDDVPTDAAALLARVVRILVQHTNDHEGGMAMLEVWMAGPQPSVVLSDPECSPRCLTQSGRLAEVASQRVAMPGHAHRHLNGGDGVGLLLSWTLDPSSTFSCLTHPSVHGRR